MIPTSAKKRIPGCEIDPNNSFVSDAKSNTVAILIRLFKSKIIANKRLGFLRNSAIVRADLYGAFIAFLINEGDSEKKATSEPEINAEPSSSKSSMIIFAVSTVSKPITKKEISNN